SRNRASAARSRAEAEEARLTAIREASAVAEARELHGAEYEQLRSAREQVVTELTGAKEEHSRVLKHGQEAGE
ncbi:hypothetical protein J7S33_28335, partial [Saccharothrix algeriensis]